MEFFHHIRVQKLERWGFYRVIIIIIIIIINEVQLM